MKKAILLEEFSRIGGGQEIGISITKALQDRFKVDLITDRYHPKLNRSLFDNVTETRYSYYEGINFVRLLFNIMALRADLKHNKKDIVLHDLSINNHPNVFLFNADINIIHEPFLRDNIKSGAVSRFLTENLISASKIYSIYSDATFVLAGNYIRDRIVDDCTYLGINPRLHIIHYPVDFPETVDFTKKKKFVLTFGRINQDKELETVLKIAQNSKVNFVIAGALNRGSEEYLKKLESRKPENVRFIINPSLEKKMELFNQATVYLHSKVRENFGLSVAESVGYGCIPVVPKEGGPWTDIVEFGKYGFGYRDINEAHECINNVLGEDILNYRYIYDSRDRFSFSSFRNTFLELIDSVTSKK